MKAIQLLKQGAKAEFLSVKEVSNPSLKSNELLIKNKFSGLNFIDTYLRSGLYPSKTPFILGVEGVGVVESVGNMVDLKKYNVKNIDDLIGKRVVYYHSGSYAEYTSVSDSSAYLVPDNIPDDFAVSATIQGLTAHMLVCSIGKLTPDMTCLVHAAAGGTGRLICQIAKLKGANVIGTCSTSKVDIVKKSVDHVIDYTTEEKVEEKVAKLTNNKGVDVVFDGVGLSTHICSMKSVKQRGLVVFFGNASGPIPPIDPLSLVKYGSIFITRPTLAHYISDYSEFSQRFTDIFTWIEKGQLEIKIDKIFKLEDAGKAHDYIESGQTKGKVLLKI